METYKPIKNFDGYYEVSNYGNCRSVERVVIATNRVIKFKQKQLKAAITNANYRFVVLCKNGISKPFTIHRLVAIAFIPNLLNKKEVNHIDGNKNNNTVENLEWVTASENMKNANDRIGVYKKGINNPRSTPVIKTDKNGIYINSYGSINEAAQKNNCGAGHISECMRGKRKQVMGFIYK